MGEACTSRKLKPGLGTRTRINVNVSLHSRLILDSSLSLITFGRNYNYESALYVATAV